MRANLGHVCLTFDGASYSWILCRCDTTRRTGNVVVAAVRDGGAADLQGVVQPSDTVCLVLHDLLACRVVLTSRRLAGTRCLAQVSEAKHRLRLMAGF